MTFTLLPQVAGFVLVFALVAAVGALALVGLAMTFAVDHHAERVRRHESLVHYYGHLALGR